MAALIAACAPAVQAQALLEEVTTLSSGASTFEGSVEIAAAGSYQLRLTDFGVPASFSSLRAIVTRGLEIVTTANAPGQTSFDTTAGTHEIHVVGTPGAGQNSGTFGVEIRSADGLTTIGQFAGAISLPVPPNPNQSTVQAEFNVTDGGTYQVVLADLAFPAALQSVNLNILGPGGFVSFTPPGAPSAPGTYSFAATAPGTYQLLVVAEATSADTAGVFSVRISGGPAGAVLYDQAHAVGSVVGPTAITLPASGSYTFRLADFNAPEAFAKLSAILMRGSSVIAQLNGAGDTSFGASPGSTNLFLVAAPAASSGSGTVAMQIASGATVAYSDARTINAPGAAKPGFTFPAAVTTAGPHRVALTDFQFPAAFGALSLNVIQAGASLGSLNAAGSLDVTPAAGQVFLTVITQPQTASSNHLFGVQLVPAAGGTVLLDVTQGVGSLFDARTVDVAAAGSYDVTLADLGFPATFSSLAMAVTHGPDRVGSTFGNGTFSFPASPGRYVLNFVAAPASSNAGTYGLRVAPTPPAPNVTLGATPSAVSSGGTTTLNWSSTSADSCVASGAWSGNRPTSGSENSAALMTSSTFSLRCTGAGGSTERSVTVTIAAASSGGGGGALGPWSLLCLAVSLQFVGAASPILQRRRRIC